MSIPPTAPEALRGSWYRLKQPANDPIARDDAKELVTFGIDGNFVRYELKGASRKPVGKGDYTYDGSFLILRARRTHTFRVHRSSFWRWDLEGKKKSYALVRGFVPDGQVEELPEEESRDIRLIPVRARVESHFKDGDDIYRLVYEHGQRDRRCLATFCVDDAIEDRLWVGLTPFVRGLDPRTWQRIIEESFLDSYLDKKHRPQQTTLEMMDSRERLRL